MELLYEVEPDLDGAEDYVVSSKRMKYNSSRNPLVSVSVKNLLAFTSHVDLTGSVSSNSGAGAAGKPGSGKRSAYSPAASPSTADDVGIAGCHLYVTDLNTPWEIFLIKNTTSQITTLAWDPPGSKLFVGMEDGTAEVYGMVDHLLNKWAVSYSACLPGEPVLTSAWLSAPRKVTLNPEKVESMVYSEKYATSVPFSSGGFGGKGLDGVVLLSATGLVGAILVSALSEESNKPVLVWEKIAALRSHISFADMTYSEDGDIFLVTGSENIKQPVLINKLVVSLATSADKGEIKGVPCQSLFLQGFSDDHAISSVQFINKCSQNHLLISLRNRTTSSSTMCLYELVAHSIPVKSRFAASTSGNDVINAFKWQQTSLIQFGSLISSLTTLALPSVPGLSLNMQNQNQSQTQQTMGAILTPLIATALSNGSIVLSRCDNLAQVGSMSIQNQKPIVKWERDEVNPGNGSSGSCSKTLVSSPGGHGCPVSLAFTWSGSVLVGLTPNSHLQAWKIHPNLDASTAALLLELGMMGGLDPWDVMMCVRPPLVDNITDRLSETFARQPPPVQIHYNARILVLKAALYRLGSSGSARINDQQTLLVLYLVSGAMKCLLRPAELSSREKGPAESLSSLINSSGDQYADLTKVLVQMAATEYAVEHNTLQSLQQILQWCADLALKLLSTLPDLRHSRAPGWEVCRDSKAVGTLRELIVLMRIWGLQRPSCLPAFRKTSENLDVLPLLFRLLTRLSIAPHDPDETLIDECCLLPSEVQIPNHTAYCPTKSLGMSSNILFSRGCPQQFQFGVLPLKWWVGVETNGNWMDGLRLLWLGKNPAGVKICNRCGCTTLLSLPPRSTANKAWDQRWRRCCPCGGMWKVPAFLPQPKVADADFLNHL